MTSMKRNKVSTLIYKYELQTAVYMLEPWEKILFSKMHIIYYALSPL